MNPGEDGLSNDRSTLWCAKQSWRPLSEPGRWNPRRRRGLGATRTLYELVQGSWVQSLGYDMVELIVIDCDLKPSQSIKSIKKQNLDSDFGVARYLPLQGDCFPIDIQVKRPLSKTLSEPSDISR